LWQVPSDTSVAALGSAHACAGAGVGTLGPSSQVSAPTSQESSATFGTASFVLNTLVSQEGSEGDTSSVIGLSASQGGGGGGLPADPSFNPELPQQGTWPANTDLVFIPGTRRLTLTLQRVPLRAIVQDTFENMRAFLLLNYSFPDATNLPMVIKDCLITAATESHYPSASDIRKRLIRDNNYMDLLSRLVSVSYY
jgi:hypothetical protein